MRWAFLCVAWLLPALAQAHKASDSYLRLEVKESLVSGRWDIGLRDLDYALGLDADGDGRLTWGEVRDRQADIQALALSRLTIEADGTLCRTLIESLRIVDLNDGAYAALPFRSTCLAPPRSLSLRYDLLFDLDPQHRGLLRLSFQASRSGVFSPNRRTLEFASGAVANGVAFRQYFTEGLGHIARGLDHWLFLIALLLPAVLRREPGRWVPVESLSQGGLDVLRIVTAFTLAHACTLTLASLGLLRLPTRGVEALVAATIVFAALNNLLPLVRKRLWRLALGFGLIHGAGYASVLADLELPTSTLVISLLAFNLGVEGAQIVIATLFLPLAFLFRRQPWYQWGVVGAGSLAVAGFATLWLIQRTFNLQFGV